MPDHVITQVLSQSFTRFHYYFKAVICLLKNHRQDTLKLTIEFKGSHYPKDGILNAVFFYVRYAVSYLGLEEIMAERGVQVDKHPLVHCCVLTCRSRDDRFIKKITRPTLGFKAFHSAAAHSLGLRSPHDLKEAIPDKSYFTIQIICEPSSLK